MGRLRTIALVIAVLSSLTACSRLQLVAQYDAKTLEQTMDVGKKVDVFYGMLLEIPAAERLYEPFAREYVQIGAEIAGLVRRNTARPLNSESTQIATNILDLWRKYQDKHKTKDGYSDGEARLDRGRFERMFDAAVSAEAAKRDRAAREESDGLLSSGL